MLRKWEVLLLLLFLLSVWWGLGSSSLTWRKGMGGKDENNRLHINRKMCLLVAGAAGRSPSR
jgi:hypothetical protein